VSDSGGRDTSGPRWGRLSVVLVVIAGVLAVWFLNTGDEEDPLSTVTTPESTLPGSTTETRRLLRQRPFPAPAPRNPDALPL